MATQKEIIKKYIQTFKDIKTWTIDDVNEEIVNNNLSDNEIIEEYEEIMRQVNHLIDVALGQAVYDNLDEEIMADIAEKENTRNVPNEPLARAQYVISRIKTDVERYRACRDYNLKHGVDIKQRGIKYEYRLAKQEYRDIAKDYKYIIEKLNGELKKHRPVFEELIMKGLTLEEYGRLKKGPNGDRKYLIKWAFNKKMSFIKALGKCYANDMSSMNYYNGIQKENAEYDGRDYYMVEREIVSDALSLVDKHQKEYFLAMKEAYEEIYETVESMRKESKEKPDISFI